MITKNYLFLFLFLFFYIQSAFSQFAWEKSYPDSLSNTNTYGLSHCTDMITTSDGGFAMIGETDFPTGAIRHNLRLVKTDSQGEVELDTTFFEGEITALIADGLCEGTDGTYGVLSFGGELTAKLWKVASDGEILWERDIFAGIGTGRMPRVYPLPDGGFRVLGFLISDVPYFLATTFYDYNAEGQEIMEGVGTFEGSYNSTIALDFLTLQNESAKLIVGTVYLDPTEDDARGFVRKITANGETEWEFDYESANIQSIHRVLEHENNFYIGGTQLEDTELVPMIGKINQAGELLWSTTVDLPDNIGIVNDIVITPDNRILAVGSYDKLLETASESEYFPSFLPKGFIATLNLDGTVEEIIVPDDNISYSSIEITADGCLAVAGISDGFYLASSCGFFSALSDVSISSDAAIYPNPSNGIFTIDWKSEDLRKKALRLVDNLGRVVLEKNMSGENTTINTASLVEGNYWVQFFEGDKFLGAKLVVVN